MWFAVVYILFPLALGALVNVTIDDTYGDPITGAQFTYSPPGSWNVGQNCTACTARPHPGLLDNQTWHDGMFYPVAGLNLEPNVPILATVQFSGTAVYVQCVIVDSFAGPDGNTDMVFYIDNDVVGSYVRAPQGTGTYLYNITVYANSSIPAGQHTLVVQTGHVNGNESLFIIDSVIYSTDLSAQSPLQSTTLSNSLTLTVPPVAAQPSSESTHVNSINSTRVTVIAASGVALIFIAFLLWSLRRRLLASTDPDPLIPPHPTSFHVNGDVGKSSSLGSMVTYNGVPVISIPQPGRQKKRSENENAYMADRTGVSPGVPSSSNVHNSSEAGYSGGGVLGIGSDTMSQVPDDAPPAYDPFQRPPTIRGSAGND